jgi:hypothetical protein
MSEVRPAGRNLTADGVWPVMVGPGGGGQAAEARSSGFSGYRAPNSTKTAAL